MDLTNNSNRKVILASTKNLLHFTFMHVRDCTTAHHITFDLTGDVNSGMVGGESVIDMSCFCLDAAARVLREVA